MMAKAVQENYALYDGFIICHGTNTFYGRSGAQWKGIGQAKAVVFFLVVVVISLIQLKFTRSKEVQQ